MSDVVACPIVFILFYEQDWQGAVFKVMKNDRFLVLLLVLGLLAQISEEVNE